MNSRLALVLASAVLLGGCRAREYTSLQRKEAASIVSEAEFAVTLSDWNRAEGLFAKAAEICPDEGGTWANLAIMRMHLHNPSGARTAYKTALADYVDEAERAPANSGPVLRQAYLLVILGRADEARTLIARATARLPEDRRLRAFVENKGLENLIADPRMKDLSP